MATPATIDLELIRGDDFEQQFQIVTCDVATPTNYPSAVLTEPTVIDGVNWTPLDLTSSTVMSQIRRTTSYAEAKLLDFTITMNNASIGLFTMSLTNAQTTTLSMNDTVKYRYDTQVVTAANKITTYAIGAVNVTLDVTR